MTEKNNVPYGVQCELARLGITDSTFRELPGPISEETMRRCRAYHKPFSFDPPDYSAPVNSREYSGSLQDLVNLKLVEFGYLTDDHGNRLSRFGVRLTDAGLAIVRQLEAVK